MDGSICLPIDLIQSHLKFLSSIKVKWNDSEVFQWVLGILDTDDAKFESFLLHVYPTVTFVS